MSKEASIEQQMVLECKQGKGWQKSNLGPQGTLS